MEPFGLFQILQSFLNKTPIATANTTDTEEQTPSESVPTPSAEGEIEKEHQEEERTSPNAFLSFMDAHDKRARRLKKP